MLRPARQLTSLLCVALIGLTGCAGTTGSSDSRPNEDATLLLDFAPNAVHAGLYLALERGYDKAEGVDLEVRAPGSSTNGVKALLSGRADMAIVDLHDLAIAREKGRDLVAFMAVVQTPLAAILAQPDVRRPRDLEGRRAGVTGLPSDDAVLRSIVAGDGGDPDKVRTTTIGFTAVSSLLAGKVSGATAFWNAEGVALRTRRPAIREFRVERFGAPSYPELVFVATRETLENDLPVLRATVRAVRRGYTAAIIDPPAAVSALTSEEPDLDPALTARELDAVSASFTAGAGSFGELDPARLREWATWEQEFGITEGVPDVAAMFSAETSVAGAGDDPS